ncbi:MAG: flagellar hook capping FlgD N-terminal domain-containing protein [Mahellales bacterium]|jgi:flagellar basal-body rod modification protein FlgD
MEVNTLLGTGQMSTYSTGNRQVKEYLGKDEFLNLLITQLRNQDPLSPIEDREFISQMAQFSTLEQTTNLNKSIMQMQAANLIGKKITASVADGNGVTYYVTGIAESARYYNGMSYVVVEGIDVALENIIDIEDASQLDGDDAFDKV